MENQLPYGKITRRDLKNAIDYVFHYRYIIEYWKKKLGLQHLIITTELIDREQVTFPDDISEEDRYFVGIALKDDEAIITHDRDLTEEDIVHELLHLAHPEKTGQEGEDWINIETKNKIDYDKSKNSRKVTWRG